MPAILTIIFTEKLKQSLLMALYYSLMGYTQALIQQSLFQDEFSKGVALSAEV